MRPARVPAALVLATRDISPSRSPSLPMAQHVQGDWRDIHLYRPLAAPGHVRTGAFDETTVLAPPMSTSSSVHQ
jgi:hypothetical protein